MKERKLKYIVCGYAVGENVRKPGRAVHDLLLVLELGKLDAAGNHRNEDVVLSGEVLLSVNPYLGSLCDLRRRRIEFNKARLADNPRLVIELDVDVFFEELKVGGGDGDGIVLPPVLVEGELEG